MIVDGQYRLCGRELIKKRITEGVDMKLRLIYSESMTNDSNF